MVGRVRRFIRRLGYDLAPFPGAAPHWARIGELLARHRITLVLDVGANAGQYAQAIINNGYRGRIVSFEPTSLAHQRLCSAAASHSTWAVAARCAVGAEERSEIEVRASEESDMSSLLPMTAPARDHMPTAAATRPELVPIVTLAAEWERYVLPDDRVFVKVDTQGYEDKVVDGLGERIARVTGLQLELSLQPIYEGQSSYVELSTRIDALGFEPAFVVPGYYSRHFARMIDFDMVWFRPVER